MILIFLLQFINSFEGLCGTKYETLCTSNTCYTLHMDKVRFEKAHQKCVNNGGSLMTVRDRYEEDVLHSLLSQSKTHFQGRAVKCWIGLKLPTEKCVSEDSALWGFKWVSGEEDSQYSNWEKTPDMTCINEMCVSVNYTASGQNQLKWIPGSCKIRHFYACKFYFKGMCKPLVLLGHGNITYTVPFSERPERNGLKLFPLGTYAIIKCHDERSDYSVCLEKGGVFRWTVPGPFCKTEKQNCLINNGGCEHECRLHEDEVKCFCKEGYDLDEDGLSCRIKNLCGVDTCEYQCSMEESGYSCKCPHGFKLDENQRNCSDIDECQSQVCEDHLCINTLGSYTCACEDGYKMINGICNDVNECDQSKCQHRCLNTVGSYSCSCYEGFALSEDGHSCEDINECVYSSCEFKCINTFGSYMCTCPQGSYVEAHGLNCIPDVAETSTASSDDAPDEKKNSTESLSRATVELQHQSPQTDAPLTDLVNITHDIQPGNTSLATGFAKTVNSRLIICVVGSVVPLLVLIAVTLAIAIVGCSRSKKEAKKKTTTDGYCWVSPGLDPRLEKLYESILTDDL